MTIYIVYHEGIIEGAFSSHEKAMEAAYLYRMKGHYFTPTKTYGIVTRQVDCMFYDEETEKPY